MVLEPEVADLGVVRPESMSVCTVLPSENKYRLVNLLSSVYVHAGLFKYTYIQFRYAIDSLLH